MDNQYNAKITGMNQVFSAKPIDTEKISTKYEGPEFVIKIHDKMVYNIQDVRRQDRAHSYFRYRKHQYYPFLLFKENGCTFR